MRATVHDRADCEKVCSPHAYEWRSERAKEMVLGSLRKAGAKAVEHQ
jgi:hypothetical protein